MRLSSTAASLAAAQNATRALSWRLLRQAGAKRAGSRPNLIHSPGARVRPSLVQGGASRLAVPPKSPATSSNVVRPAFIDSNADRNGGSFGRNGSSNGHAFANGGRSANGHRRNGATTHINGGGLLRSNGNGPPAEGVARVGTADVADTSEQPETTTTTTRYSSDLVVVLDMDECLIHSQFLSQGEDVYRQWEAERSERIHEQMRRGASEEEALLEEEMEVPTCESFQVTLPDGDVVRVNKRPHLGTFLEELSSRFETHIFTAAMKVYASPVLDVLDPTETLLNRRFYRESCLVDEELGVYVKDLEAILGDDAAGGGGEARQDPHKRPIDGMNGASSSSSPATTAAAGFNERRVVLVDNNPLSFLANPSNGILVSNFYDDPHDETLPAVLELLHQLDGEDDVRPVLDDMFGLREALHEVSSAAGRRNKQKR